MQRPIDKLIRDANKRFHLQPTAQPPSTFVRHYPNIQRLLFAGLGGNGPYDPDFIPPSDPEATTSSDRVPAATEHRHLSVFHLLQRPEHMLASLLDPSFRTLQFAGVSYRDTGFGMAAWKSLENEVHEFAARKFPLLPCTCLVAYARGYIAGAEWAATRGMHPSIFARVTKAREAALGGPSPASAAIVSAVVGDDSSNEETASGSVLPTIEANVSDCLQAYKIASLEAVLDGLSHPVDCLLWWRDTGVLLFPYIAPLALKYHSILPSTGPTERLFKNCKWYKCNASISDSAVEMKTIVRCYQRRCEAKGEVSLAMMSSA